MTGRSKLLEKYQRWWYLEYLPDGRQIVDILVTGPNDGHVADVDVLLDDYTWLHVDKGDAPVPRKKDLVVVER